MFGEKEYNIIRDIVRDKVRDIVYIIYNVEIGLVTRRHVVNYDHYSLSICKSLSNLASVSTLGVTYKIYCVEHTKPHKTQRETIIEFYCGEMVDE